MDERKPEPFLDLYAELGHSYTETKDGGSSHHDAIAMSIMTNTLASEGEHPRPRQHPMSLPAGCGG